MRHSLLVNSSPRCDPRVWPRSAPHNAELRREYASISKQWEANGSRRGRQQKIAAFGLSTRQRPIVNMSKNVQEQLDRLMRTAARRQEAPARRTASVRSMHSLLRTPQGQAAGQAMLPILWPAVLQLLQDSQTDMRQTVAPVVGFLGALAARPGRPAGVSPNLLFEWAMPVLSGQGIGVWTHLDMSVQCWVLVALKEGLAAVEIPVLHQHALAVLTLCHSLLRSEGTSVHLIAPVLGLVSEAARHLPSLRTMFRGLVDLLVAWWLEPRLDDIVRPLLARTLDSLKQGWQHDPALGKALLARLLQDVQAVTSAKSGVSTEGLKRFMRLCGCMEAIVSGCGPRIGVDLPELLGQWISGMHKGYDKFYALPNRLSAQTSSALEQLCTYIQHAITAALMLGQHTQTVTPLQQNILSVRMKASSAQQGQVASGPVQVATSSPVVQSASLPMQTLASPILDFVSAVASSEAVQASALLHLLKLAQCLVDAMQQQQCEAAPKQVEVLMDADSAVGKLRRHSQSQVTEAYVALHGLLLTALSTRAAATQQVIQHILQISQHLPTGNHFSSASNAADGTGNSIGQAGGGDAGEDGGKGDNNAVGVTSRAADKLNDQLADISSGVAALTQAVAAHQDGDVCTAIWKQLVHLATPAGPLETSPDVWVALLSLLHHSWQNTRSISTHELATLLAKLARSTAHTRVHSLVIEWASDAAMQYLSPAKPAHHSIASLSIPRSPAAVGQQNPGQADGLQHLDLICPDTFSEVLIRLCRAPEPQTRLIAVQALSRLLHAGSRFQPHQLVAATDVACYHLTDPSELVSDASIQLLLGLAAPASFSIMSSAVPAAHHELPWRRLYALQPQQVAFQPEQLAELLQWLGQTAPLVVSRPGSFSGGAANDKWLWSMLKSCQTMGLSATFPLTSGAAAWHAVQEAAKQCTAVRMRTHLGNPSQTFAALEQLLQGMLTRLNAAGPDPSQAVADSTAPLPQLYSVPASRSSSVAPLLEPSWMLLELMHALEKNMYSAYAGSCLRPVAFASAAVAFYKSNRKVCEDWFTRMRMLLLRTSAASNSPHLTLHHAFARLADLKAQLRHLQAAAATEAAQQLQAQLQAQRQQTQLRKAEAEAAEQALEPKAQTTPPSLFTSAVTVDSANIDHLPSTSQSISSQRQGRPYQPHLQPDQFKPGSPGPAPSAGQGSPAQQPQSPSAGAVLALLPVSTTLAPASLFRPDAVKSDRTAPLGLLEIQAEQEAEAARAAEAAAARSSHGRGSHRASAKQAPSYVSDGPAQRGQSRVLQVKRQKPGQVTPMLPTPKVLPLTKAPSGKVVVATPAPTPGKIKLMARPQSAAEGAAATLQSGGEGRADSTSKQHLTPSHARTARAQAARRLSSELQEVLRHAALAILHIADADAVVGLHQYCQRNFSALPQLVHAGSDDEAAESRVGMEGLSSDSSKPRADRQQFDWLYGVTLQASARHEEAAVVYTRYLQQPDKADTCGPEGQAFLVARCCEAYASVADWEGLQQWLQDLKGQKQAPNGRDTSWPLAPAQEHKFDALAAFDAGQLQEAQHAFDLSVWSDLKGDKGGVHAAQSAEATSLKALMQLHAHSSAKQRPDRDKRLIRTLLQDSKDTLLQSLSVTAQTGLRNTTAQLTALHCLAAVQESVPAPAAAALAAVDAPPGFAPKAVEPSAQPQPAFALRLWPFGNDLPQEADLNHWPVQDPQPLLQLLRVHKVLAAKGKQEVPQRLLLDAVQSSAASGNHRLADRLVADYAANSKDREGLLSLRLHLLRFKPDDSASSVDITSASGQLWVLVKPLLERKTSAAETEPASLQAQALLQLAHWCKALSPDQQGSRDVHSIQSLGQQSQVIPSLKVIADGATGPQPYLPPEASDQAVCLGSAVKLIPGSASAWLAYADYLHTLCHPAATRQHPPAAQSSPEAEASALANSLDASTPHSSDSNLLQDLTREHIVIEMVKAYCTHLQLAVRSSGHAGMPEDHMPILLKLLQLLSGDHMAPGTLHALSSGTRAISILAWQAVVPQLFAVLAHEDTGVWGWAQELLQRLEQLDPAAVLYPALVESKRISKGQAAAKPGLHALLDSCQTRQPQLVEQMATMMKELEHMSVLWIEQWHIALLELQAEVGRRVASLQEELMRVTAQAGLGMPQQLQVMRDRYTTILAPAMHMIQQRLSLNTADDAQTPQQEQFVSKHLTALKQAAAAFAHPSDDVLMHPELAWNIFKGVSRAIAQQLSAREVQLTALSPVLSELAATLVPIPGLTPAHPLPPAHPQYPSSMPLPTSGSLRQPAPEPGASAAEPYQISSADLVTVASFKPSVHVMSTKTRPKRIAMLGSDGRTYTFLLKGWEDLRLDERLMQLVRSFSVTLRSDPDTSRRQLLPCPLSVTPLGASMGLIQWVDHTMPLYGVYKAWQHRQLTDKTDMAKTQAAAAGQPSGKAVTIHPPRATDAFYAKLLPALEAAGLPRTAPRKDWPVPLLKQILTESVQETPGYLLARELWCGCGSASEWWSYQAGYTSSTAAMSMVGHLLGLGDRHLDNILLDKHTGRVVHIDYNIVFDKGQQLRVPEIVPFRLTHTLQAALGATGVEGAFRRGCEHVMRVARRNSTSLSSLLQSVLLDPLVTWSPDRDQAGTKKDADAAVALNLFHARSTEQKASCSEALSALAAALPGAAAALQAYAAVHTVADQTASTARAAHREVLEAQEAQAAAASSTEAVTIRLQQAQASIPQLVKELHANRQLLQRHLRECQGWADRHQYTVKALRDQVPAELMYPNSHWAADQAPVQLGLVSSLGASSIPSIVQAALQCSQRQITLPPMLLQQAHSIDQQATQLLAQRGQGILAGLAGLQAYSAALRQVLTPDYSDSSHHSQWARAVDSATASNRTEAMLGSLQLAPHPSNPQDILVTWHTLKALPAELAFACQHLDQQLNHIHLNRQPMLRSLADARAELISCLEKVQGGAKTDSLVAAAVRACLLAVGDEAKSTDAKSAAFNTTHCIKGLSQLAVLLKTQPEAVSCLQWVAPFSQVAETQLALEQQFVSLLPYLTMYSTCGFGPGESQHVGLVEALYTELADTEAAFAQLQQESLGHANLLASCSTQMTVLQSQLDADSSPSASSAVAQLDQLNSAWEQQEATAASLRERAEALKAHQASLACQVHSLFLAPANNSSTAAVSSMQIFQLALTKLAESLYGLSQAAQQLPQADSLVAASGAASWDSAVLLVKTVRSLLTSCFESAPGDHPLQGLSDLALEESSGPAGLTSSQGALADVGLGASAPELVPFGDFDNSVEGADQMLEHALEDDPLEHRSDPTDAGLEPEENISYVIDSSMMSSAGLVPFSDFDPALAGADQSLELVSELLESNSSPDLMHNPIQHPQTSQAEQLSLAMQDFVHCAGELATAEQQQAGVAAALSAVQLSSESWETSEQLVAFEWVHEAELEAALQPLGGLGQPALIAPKDPLSEPNWSLSIRRNQVVNALESALCILSNAEEAWLAWRHASSQTETQLRRLFRTSQQQHDVHEQFLTSRQQWLSGCDDIAGWIERMAQNVLQLERSREGVVWSRSAGADDKSFAECSALLQQRQLTCSALQSAEQEVKAAQQTLPELREQAAAAAAKLQPAQVQERQLGQSFAQQAPRLLQVAQAVVQPVRTCQKAACEAPPAVEHTQAALIEVLGHLEGSSAAIAIRASLQEAHDQLTPLQHHASALDESFSAVIEGVEHNLQASNQQQPSQSPMGKPSKGFSKSKRAALILDAMTPLLPAAMHQVQSPSMTDLSVQQLASAVGVLPEQAKAVATSIQQAYQAQAAETAVTLPLASEVADAQPSASGISVAVPQAAFADAGVGSHQSGSNSDLQDHSVSGSESDSAVLVGTAGDDLEQDTKATLKAGGQNDLLKDAMRSGLQQKEDGELQKARRIAFASATLGVFQAKLFGKASLEHRCLDVEQHVDQLLKQATSLDNLCQMYEGWTAWI
ncbi:hypothetical protein WJX77_007420 [Trebouxia sp. C0004]